MEMSPEKALEAIYNLDDLANMINCAIPLWKQWHKKPAEELEHPERIGAKLHDKIVTSDSVRADINQTANQLTSMMSQTILNATIDKIKREEIRLTKAIQDIHNTQKDIENEKNIARKEICEILNFIKEHHRGTLPGEYLNNLFWSFQC